MEEENVTLESENPIGQSVADNLDLQAEATDVTEPAELAPPLPEPEPELPEEPDIDRLVAEAEQRGYLRGLNEHAAGQMRRPAVGDRDLSPTQVAYDGNSEVMILNRAKKSVWNNA